MCVREQHAAAGEAIDIRRVYRAFVAAETIHPVLHVVHGKEQHVRLWFVRFRHRCFPTFLKHARKISHRVRILASRRDVLRFVLVGVVIVQFPSNDLLRIPVSPFDIAIAICSDGISHDVAVRLMPMSFSCTRELTERGLLPGRRRGSQQWLEASALNIDRRL